MCCANAGLCSSFSYEFEWLTNNVTIIIGFLGLAWNVLLHKKCSLIKTCNLPSCLWSCCALTVYRHRSARRQRKCSRANEVHNLQRILPSEPKRKAKVHIRQQVIRTTGSGRCDDSLRSFIGVPSSYRTDTFIIYGFAIKLKYLQFHILCML